MSVMGTFFERTYASMSPLFPRLLYSVPLMTHTSTGDFWKLTGKSGSVSCGVTAPFSWVLMHTSFCLCPPRVCFPILWKFYNQILLTFRAKFPGGFSVPLPDPRVGKSVVCPRSFSTVQELLWYSCSPVCRSSSWWVYGGANGDLLQDDLCHTSQVYGSQSSSPCDKSLLTCASAGDTQTLKGRSGSVSSGGHCSFPWVLVHTRFCLCPLSISGRCEIWFDSKCNFTPPTVLLRHLLCPWTRDTFF